jgi:hypothetical protein
MNMENEKVYTRLDQVKEVIDAWKERKEEALKCGLRANEFIQLCLDPNYFDGVGEYNSRIEPEQTQEEFQTIPAELKQKAVIMWNNQLDKTMYPYISNQEEQKELVIEAVKKYIQIYDQ